MPKNEQMTLSHIRLIIGKLTSKTLVLSSKQIPAELYTIKQQI